jgi:alkanesulfonate monooxygenase SsuD/methylene tetrahydromethanopterin reductase-like flavin-dependent oxidoreductase (luciferase family)
MRTKRIRIGFAVVRLPFHHPVRLAVQLALLDNLSRGRIDVGVGKGTIYNEYEFVGHGLHSDDSRARMEEAVNIIGRLWGGGPVTYNGKYFQVQVPQLRPRPVQRPHLPLWRGVISPSSFNECGRLGVPILTARLPVARIKERWAAYEAGLDAGGHDAATRVRLLAQSELWRNVDREEFAPDPVHLVVIPGVGEHDGHLDDAVEAGSGRFEHERHIAQRLPDLLGDRAEIAAAADRVHRPHPGQEDVVADPDARRMRQIGVARDVELGVYRLDHVALNTFGHQSTSLLKPARRIRSRPDGRQ